MAEAALDTRIGHLPETYARRLGRTVLYLAILGAIILLSLRGKNFLPVSLLLALYVAFIIVVREPLWNRTPWPLPQAAIILSLWWLFAFGISSLPKFFGTKEIHPHLAGHENYLYWALFVVLISNVLVVVGYVAVWPTRIPDDRLRPFKLEGSLSLVMVVIFWVLSIVARAYLFGLGRFGYTADFSKAGSGFQQAFAYMYEFAWLSIAALVVEFLTETDRAKRTRVAIFLGCISAFELLSVVVMGFKGYAILTFTPAIAAIWGMRRRIPNKAILAAVVVVILITPGNYEYREAINSGRVPRGDFFTAAEASIEYTVRGFGSDPIESLVLVWESVTFEFADFLENTALILYKTPSQVPHRGADWYFSAAPRLLFPRFIWKDKPVDDMASYMTVVYRAAPPTSGSPPGFTGEMYMRAGAGGVIAGSLIAGMLIGFVTRIFSRNKKKFLFVAGSAVISTSISNTHIDSFVIYLVHRSLIFTAAAWFMFFGVRKQQAPTMGVDREVVGQEKLI